MNKDQRNQKISELMNTSVADCRQLLQHHHEPRFLCDLLIATHRAGMASREDAVRARISQLMRNAGGAR